MEGQLPIVGNVDSTGQYVFTSVSAPDRHVAALVVTARGPCAKRIADPWHDANKMHAAISASPLRTRLDRAEIEDYGFTIQAEAVHGAAVWRGGIRPRDCVGGAWVEGGDAGAAKALVARQSGAYGTWSLMTVRVGEVWAEVGGDLELPPEELAKVLVECLGPCPAEAMPSVGLVAIAPRRITASSGLVSFMG